MTVDRILKEPMIINGITDRKEQQRRIRQVLEEVKLAPIEDFLPKFPTCSVAGSSSAWLLLEL